jgi:hypothetical protein
VNRKADIIWLVVLLVLIIAACIAACLMPGCTRTPSQAGVGATQPAPAILSCVAIGPGAGVLVAPDLILCAAHFPHEGTLTWPDGETATATFTTIPGTDLAVGKLDHPLLHVTPAAICKLGHGYFRNRLGILVPCTTIMGYAPIEAAWPKSVLMNDDSGSPHLQLLKDGSTGVDTIASGIAGTEGFGPALLAYASEIGAAK